MQSSAQFYTPTTQPPNGKSNDARGGNGPWETCPGGQGGVGAKIRLGLGSEMAQILAPTHRGLRARGDGNRPWAACPEAPGVREE